MEVKFKFGHSTKFENTSYKYSFFAVKQIGLSFKAITLCIMILYYVSSLNWPTWRPNTIVHLRYLQVLGVVIVCCQFIASWFYLIQDWLIYWLGAYNRRVCWPSKTPFDVFFKQSLFIVCTCNEKLLPSFFSPHEMFKKLLKQELCGHNLFHSITPRVYDVADQQRWCAFSSWFCKPSWIVPSSMHSVWNLSHTACGSAIYNIE